MDKRITYYRNREDKEKDEKYISFSWEWFKPTWLDLHILFPVLERVKDINFIYQETYERVLNILKAHSQANELQNAVMWFDSEKNKIESQLKKSNTRMVNQEEIFEDYFEKKENQVTNKLMSFFGGK